MAYHPITPFGRTTESVRIALEQRSTHAPSPCPLDKWQILRDLTEARTSFGLSDRDLTVLQALLSCHPDTRLDASGPLIVHPSNETICARANGMPCSTMRRHLAKLVSEGFLIRRDSPNGKRYARRVAGTKISFGFDLSPMLHRGAEIAQAAESCRTEAAERAALRQTVSLLRRDLLALLDMAKIDHRASPELDQLADLAAATTKAMRRKLDAATLSRIEAALRAAVDTMTRFVGCETVCPSTNVAQNEQHQQSSIKESQDSESTQAPCAMAQLANGVSEPNECRIAKKATPTLPPLRLILGTCTEIAVFNPEPITDWKGLVRAADRIRPMSGISDAVWHEAKSVMGAEQAATVFGAMLQRFSAIRNPGGYLRSLVTRAREGAFSPIRMVMALQPLAR